MTSTYTTNKGFEQPAHNDYVDTWDVPVNADWAAIDTALGGVTSFNATGLSGDQTFSTTQYRPLTLKISGAPTAALTVVIPSGVGGQWVFVNNTTGGYNIGIKSAAGGSTVLVPVSTSTLVTCDGTSAGMRLSVSTPPAAAGSTTQIQYNSGGLLAGSANLIFDGTTLTSTGLAVAGNTTLGSGSGSTLTLNGTAIAAPNGLNFASNTLYLSGGVVAIGTATPTVGAALTVAGNIKITTGGLIFSDGTQLLSASSLAPGGSSGNVQYNNGSGGFAAESAFTYNAGTHTLTVTNLAGTHLTATDLALTTPLPVASGGTGVAVSTGTVAVVLSTSPALAGTPTAPTAAYGTNTTQLATTAFVQDAVSAVPTLGYRIFAAGYWNGATTTNAKNVASVSHPSTGIYTVTFTTPNADANYIVVVTPLVGANNRYFTIYDQQASYFTFSNGGDNVGAQDISAFSFVIFLLGNS